VISLTKVPVKNRFKTLHVPILTAVAALFLYLVWVVLRLQLDYSDGYQILLNARAIAFLDGTSYSLERSFFLSLPLVPIFWLERFLQSPVFSFVTSHLVNLVFFGLLLWVSYRLFRLGLSTTLSLISLMAMAFNPLFIHYAPFLQEGMIAALLTVSAFYFYLRGVSKGQTKYFVIAGFFIGAAVMSRHHLALPILIIIVLHEAWITFSGRAKGSFWLRLIPLLCLPLGFCFVVIEILYSLLGLATFANAFGTYFASLDVLSQTRESVYLPLLFLGQSMSWPLLVTALLGCWAAVRGERLETRFVLLWLGVFFMAHTFFIGHKEVKFLLPLLPAAYFLFGFGLEALFGFFSRKKWPEQTPIVLTLLMFVTPVWLMLRECVKWQDPIYRTGFHEAVSRQAAELVGPNTIYWVGAPYPLVAENKLSKDGNQTDVHELTSHVVGFYAWKPTQKLPDDVSIRTPRPGEKDVFLDPRAKQLTGDGDVLIINRGQSGLVMERIREIVFTTDNAELGVFKNAESSSGLTRRENQILGNQLPNELYSIFVKLDGGGETVWLGFARAVRGRLSIKGTDIAKLKDITSITLRYFDVVHELSI